MASVRSGVAVSAAVMLLVCGQASAIVIPTFRTVALSGTDGVYGPGLGSGEMFNFVDGAPALNASGQVAFRGSSLASTGGLPNGVWMRPDATNTSFNTNLAIEGGAQPGGGVYTGPNSYNTIHINNAGAVAFRLGTGKGVFASDGVTMKRVALAGDIAPGTGSATYAATPIASGFPLFNQAGAAAFVGSLTTTSGTPPVTITAPNNNASAIFIGSGDNTNNPNGSVMPVVRGTDWFASLGGTSADTKIGTFSGLTMTFNGNGHYAITSVLQGSAVVTGTGASSNSVALISNRTGSNEAIARVGNAAPDSTGAASVDVFRTFGADRIAINNLGHVGFTASLRQGATQSVASAIFTDVGGGPLRRFASAAGAIGNVYAFNDNTTPLAEFGSITYGASATFSNVMLNGNDEMVFTANMSSGGATVLKRDAMGNLHRVVRVGDNLLGGIDPLTTGGTGVSTVSGISNVSVNLLGQVAYTTNLTGPGVSAGLGNGSALWAQDLDGSLLLIARTGTTFVDALGNSHIVSQIGFGGSANQDGQVSSFSDTGDLAFRLSFTDGSSGIFVTHVPAPGAAGLLGLAGLMAARRRRQR